MNYTENLTLGLPEYGEDADVADLNRNSGILDAYCYNTRQIECEPYDSTKNYMSGDLSIHNEVIYECNTDNTTGTWDDSKWDSTTLAEQIAKAKQSGGESALADLEDVNLTNPSEGQILTYDDTNDEWVNTDMPDTEVTKTASGNPIELTDAASAPMVKCVTEIQGSQDLHGYDKPWVGGAGKNKARTYTFTGLNSSVTFAYDDNGVTLSGTASGNTAIPFSSSASNFTFNLPAGTYTASMIPTKEGVTVQIVNQSTGNVLSNNPTFTINDDMVVYYRLSVTSGTVSDGTYKVQLERGSTATAYEPYSNICPITAYTEGEIVSAGKNLFDNTRIVNKYFSPSTGEVSAQGGWTMSGKVYVEGNKTYYYYASEAPGNSIIGCWDASDNYLGYVYYATGSALFTTLPNTRYIRFEYIGTVANISVNVDSTDTSFNAYATTNTTTYPSAIYRGSEDVVNGEVEKEWAIIDLGDRTWTKSGVRFYTSWGGSDAGKPYANATEAGNYLTNAVCTQYHANTRNAIERDSYAFSIHDSSTVYLTVVDSRYSTVEDFKTAMSGVMVAYPLATPTTSSVTPTNLPIKSLSGYNHIESTTGEMEVEYITEEYQPLVDLIQSSKHVYSTQEQIVGTWVDGSTVYERVIDLGADTQIDYNTWTLTNIDLTNIPRIISVSGLSGDGNAYYGDILGGNNNGYLQLLTTRNNTYVTVRYLIFRYTKSATTRSLSATLTSQKAQIEPLTDKTEEVPTEEEKAVNEEENTNENR